MPGIDGWEVLRRLRFSESTKDLQVIVSSMSGERMRAESLGAADYLATSIPRALLVDVLVRFAPAAWADVLVVDDDADARQIVVRLLERSGHRNGVASTGTEALNELAIPISNLIGLVVLMPDTDGFRALNAIRDSPEMSQIPVIVGSAQDFPPRKRPGRANMRTRC